MIIILKIVNINFVVSMENDYKNAKFGKNLKFSFIHNVLDNYFHELLTNQNH